MFLRKKQSTAYDPAKEQPVLKCSICTGERVAGFRDKATGKINEVMLIRGDKDLELFRADYGLAPDCEIIKVY